jgi:hypothetical protein
VRIDIFLQQLAFGEHIRISQLVDHGNHQHKPPAGIGNFVEVSLTMLLAVKLLTDHKAKQQAVTVYVILHTVAVYSTMPRLIIRTTPRTVGSIAVYFTEGRYCHTGVHLSMRLPPILKLITSPMHHVPVIISKYANSSSTIRESNS